MTDFTPHVLVSLVALGMALAFLSADRDSMTSRALACALAFIGMSIFLNVVVAGDAEQPAQWSALLALPESLATVSVLEWLLLVRRTVPARAGMNVATGDRLLRIGQVSGALYTVFAVIWPEVRIHQFLRAGTNPEAFFSWGFWLFATPLLFASLMGLAGVLLLLNRKPDKAERIRVLAVAISVPFFMAGFVLPLREAAISVVIGEIVFLIGAVRYHVMQGQRGQFMSRFLSPQVARLVAERGLASAMKENSLELSVVCCDLRGFTPFAQAHSSSRVLQVLREYYDEVGKIVGEHGATIKDFAGDGILILVGAPLAMPDHARRGLSIARRIRDTGMPLTQRWSAPDHRLGIGVGVASGTVTVGVIGSASRLEYTAVGSAVNLASRLCEQARHGEILVGGDTVALAGEAGLAAREPMNVKGFAGPVANFALAGP